MIDMDVPDAYRIVRWFLARSPRQRRLSRRAGYLLGGDREDLVQESLLHALKHPARPGIRLSTEMCNHACWTRNGAMTRKVNRRYIPQRFEPIREETLTENHEPSHHWELLRDIRAALRFLTRRERMVIELRFGVGDGHAYTLSQCGEILKLTRERVRQIEQAALKSIQVIAGFMNVKELRVLEQHWNDRNARS